MDEEKVKAKSIVSLDDLDLEYSGDLNIDPNADAFAGLDPVPDGVHLVKLALFKSGEDTGLKAGKGKNDGKPFIMAKLVGTVVEEGKPYDKFKIFDQVSTMVMRTGTCRVAGVLSKLGIRVPASTNPRELMKALVVALEGEPVIGVETQWQASSLQADGNWKTLLRGMKRFPPRVNPETKEVIAGEYVSTVEDPNTGEPAKAQAAVLRYLTVEEANKEMARAH